MTVSIDGTAGITTPAVTSSGTDEAATQTQGGVAMPRMVLSTAQNTTSGTSIDFTTIPSWVKRITVMFNGVSTSGTSATIIQIGAGSVTTTGYASGGMQAGATNVVTGLSTTSGLLVGNGVSAANLTTGAAVLTTMGSNLWVMQSSGGFENVAYGFSCGGKVSLSGTLDRLRLTTIGGTDTFDAGSVNILYEG